MADVVVKTGDIGSDLIVTVLNVDGTVADLTSATAARFLMRAEDSAVPVVNAVAAVVSPGTLGQLTYTWQTGDTATPDIYLGEFRVTMPGGSVTYPADGYLTIEVLPALDSDIADAASTLFCTIADVKNYAHMDVSASSLQTANTLIEILVGRTVSDAQLVFAQNPFTGPQDAYWLRVATAYEAAWVDSQADLFSRWSISSISSAGNSSTIKSGAETYGPLAAKAANKVSWMKSRKVRTTRRRYNVFSRDFVTDDLFAGTDSSGLGAWTPL